MRLRGPILLGEDFEDDAIMFERTLRKAGELAEIQVISDGEELIKHIVGEGRFADRRIYPLPEVIFLDGQLHHRPSLGLVQFLKNQPNTRRTPVFILTGSINPAVCKGAKALGASECFEKPFTREHLQTVYDIVQNH